MRKFMTKEVAVTKAMVGAVGLDDNGLPVVTDVEHIELLGDRDKATAEKMLRKQGITKTLFKVETETRTYKMAVAEFIKIATLVTDEEPDTDEDDEEEAQEEPTPEPTPTPRTRRITKNQEA